MVKTAPETTCDEFAPIDWMMTFSSSVLLRAKRGAIPMARIEIGIAASIPWPTRRARKAAAIAKIAQKSNPIETERVVTS